MSTGCSVKSSKISVFIAAIVFCLLLFSPAMGAEDQKPAEAVLNLEDTVQNALAANLDLKRANEGIYAAEMGRRVSRASFLPTVTTTYQAKFNDEALKSSLLGVTWTSVPKNQHTFSASITQVIFAGFARKNQYDIAKLSIDLARYNKTKVRHQVIYDAKQAFFQLLKTRKLLEVARQTVKQIDAQKEVARNFYEVGMSPRNDLLQAQVELANARQRLVEAQHTAAIAEANFNTLLRRPLDAPVNIEDIKTYETFTLNLDDCQADAAKRRPEIVIADANVAIAKKQVKLAKRNYYPTISVSYNNYQIGDDWDLNGGEGVSDPSGWNVTAVASWELFSGGADYYGVRQRISELKQAKHQKASLVDAIHLEVKQAFLRTKDAESAIITSEKAIEQAEENYRINQERYKEQVATSTDVLDAQTLLTRAMTNYYSALYDFKIAKAALYRAMGVENES